MWAVLYVAGYLAAYSSSADVPVSAEAETSNFSALTEAALKRYQRDKNIVCSGTAATIGWGAVGARKSASLGI